MTYADLLKKVETYNPSKYQATRNYTNGAVTAWAPYISRGFLSPVIVMNLLKNKYPKQAWMGLMQQMAWREYFQRVWQNKGDAILTDLKSSQQGVLLEEVPRSIVDAKTGIKVIDEAIHQLYNKGYLHNHLRMYLAMLHTNIFKAAWLPAAKWMYAHLLDHDPAANFLSWQWVAGTFSSKQYVANQENINRYTNTKQVGTFLDTDYENLSTAIFNSKGQLNSNLANTWEHPLDQVVGVDTLTHLETLQQNNSIPFFNANNVDALVPFCIYNSFNLDPLWHSNEKMNRILLLEPKHFQAFPIAENVLQFIIELGRTNIEDLQIFVGNFDAFIQQLKSSNLPNPVVYFKEHPTTSHYQGIKEERDWLFPEVTGYYPSFFGYWKKCERYLT